MAIPRQTPDAATSCSAAVFRPHAPAFDDDVEPPVRRLTRAEALEIERREPPLSPWRVVAVQATFGVVAALAVFAFSFDATLALSALWGAAIVAVPGALMARGATSPLGRISPMTSTVSLLVYAVIKLAASAAMLAAAPRVVPGVSWPVMLVTLAIALQSYPFALLWRRRPAA